MKALVTGGAGFIGSHLCEYLLRGGHRVCCFDNLSTGDVRNVYRLFASNRFSFVYGSVLDRKRISALVERYDCVFHLAAEVGVKRIVDDPICTMLANIEGTHSVLCAAREYKKKVLVTSTSEVYGKNGAVPFDEEHDFVFGPIGVSRWGYAYSKIIDEFLTLSYGREFGLPVVVVRLFNVIGPRQLGRYGMVVPRFVLSALRGEPIMVHGTGEQTRCFAYVGDIVRMLVDLMICPQAEGGVYNLGSNVPVSINRLAQRVKKLAQSDSVIEHAPYEAVYGPNFQDIETRQPSVEKAKKYINCTANTLLDEALLEIIEYCKQEGGQLDVIA